MKLYFFSVSVFSNHGGKISFFDGSYLTEEIKTCEELTKVQDEIINKYMKESGSKVTREAIQFVAFNRLF